MRRRLALLFRACLAGCLVLTQLLAVLHECGHAAQQSGHVEKAPAGSGACVKCIAFASVHGGPTGSPAALDVPARCLPPLEASKYVFSPLLLVSFHAQAPPVPHAVDA